MSIKKWLQFNTSSLEHKTIAITGSTGGIANELVAMLANLGANLLLINRNKEKTLKQIEMLKSINENITIEFIQCDLADFASVKSATNLLKSKHIDILYLCAGVYNVARFKSDLQYDNIFQTNFVSHYYMVKQLLPYLNAIKGHIVAVSSIAINYSTLDEKDIDFSSRKKASKVYGNSKRFLTFSLCELMKNQSATLSIVHPGITLTEMTNHYPKAINWLVKLGIKLLFPNPIKASLSLLKGIFENTDNNDWIAPKHFNIWGCPKQCKIKGFNLDESKNIFNIAENIYEKIGDKYDN